MEVENSVFNMTLSLYNGHQTTVSMNCAIVLTKFDCVLYVGVVRDDKTFQDMSGW